jgi:hypothetical protein
MHEHDGRAPLQFVEQRGEPRVAEVAAADVADSRTPSRRSSSRV